MKGFVGLCFLFLFVPLVYAQVDTSSMNADELYSIAREMAFNGQREDGRRLCRMALEKNPGYDEIIVFMGRTYAWDGKRDSARYLFKEVLNKKPGQVDATLALADVELWDDKPMEAILFLDKSLQVYPNNYELIYKKAKALVSAQKDEEALLLLSRAIELQPGCKECIELRRSIKGRKLKHTLTVNVAGDYYSKRFNPMYYSFVQFGTTTKMGGIIGRVNYAHRFDDDGIQPEVDFYPGLWKGAYGYVNYGFTTSSLFPTHRFGGEIYQSLPKSLEASLGMRYLNFDPTTNVTIYTASVGWYIKDYWLNLRTYITPDAETFSRSFNLTSRKYFADANNYISLMVGAGFSPDARRVQTNVGLDAGNSIYFLKSQRINLGFQKTIRYNMMLNAEVYYSNQEMDVDDYIHVVGFTVGIKIRL